MYYLWEYVLNALLTSSAIVRSAGLFWLKPVEMVLCLWSGCYCSRVVWRWVEYCL